MKKAVMFSVACSHQNGYMWRWRCSDSHDASAEAFAFYHDCLRDAQDRGYDVELTHATGITAPGGERHGCA